MGHHIVPDRVSNQLKLFSGRHLTDPARALVRKRQDAGHEDRSQNDREQQFNETEPTFVPRDPLPPSNRFPRPDHGQPRQSTVTTETIAPVGTPDGMAKQVPSSSE